MALPAKVIGGLSVRDYAYLWISGGCLLHQWASGGRGIDDEVIQYAVNQLAEITRATQSDEGMKATGWGENDRLQFADLVKYLKANNGARAEPYVPDQWASAGKAAREAFDG